jgi:hypothetical protein
MLRGTNIVQERKSICFLLVAYSVIRYDLHCEHRG